MRFSFLKFCFLFFFAGSFLLNAQNHLWSKRLSGGYSYVAVDGLGNVYTTGSFTGVLDFDPSPSSSYTMASNGDPDLYVTKLDASGNFVWAVSFGGSIAQEGVKAIAVDPAGNVYLTGAFQNSIDLDPSPSSSYTIGAAGLAGYTDVFFMKLNSAGVFVWGGSLGGGYDDLGADIQVDNASNVYITGSFVGTVDFDPSPAGSYTIAGFGFTKDVFILKLDASGNFAMATAFGGNSGDDGRSIAIDNATGNIYVGGIYSGTCDFDPSVTSTYTITTPDIGAFICKLNPAGNLIWAKSQACNPLGPVINGTYLKDLDIDPAGNVYTTGYYYQSTDFDPSPSSSYYLPYTNGYAKIYVSKLDVNGNFEWAVKFGSETYYEWGNSIDVDSFGNVHTTGYFYNSVDFNPSPSATYYLSTSFSSFFISKLNTSGNFVWAINAPATLAGASASGNSIALDASGTIYATGVFSGSLDFDPSPTQTATLSAATNANVFLVKYCNNPEITSVNNGLSCVGGTVQLGASVNTGTLNWYASNTGTTSIGTGTAFTTPSISVSTTFYAEGNSFGCKSSARAPVLATILHSIYPTAFQSFSICSNAGLPVGNHTYTTSGTYIDTIQVNNCGLIMTTHLSVYDTLKTVNNVSICAGSQYTIGIHSYSATGVYTDTFTALGGCDSLVTTHLQVKNLSFASITTTACNSYVLNNITYTSSGVYTQTLTNVQGCDSLLTLNLSLKHSTAKQMTVTACDVYSLNSHAYTSSGIYTQTLTNTQGCDSLLTLDLSIKHSTARQMTVSACTAYSLNTVTYTNSGVYTQTLINTQGCDSILTVSLTILHPTAHQMSITACDVYVLNHLSYTTSGVYTQTLSNSQGCDSLLTLNLTLKHSSTSQMSVSVCDSYTLNALTYTNSGVYTQTLTNVQGCDSLLTLHLLVKQRTSSQVSVTACNSYSLNTTTYTSSGVYTQTLTNSQGCDSLLTLYLTINHSTSRQISVNSCDNYSLNGFTYTLPGIYTQTLVNTQGCDSLLTLTLTLMHSSAHQISATACNSYSLNAQTYTTSGIYTQTLTNAQGCDSLLTLNLSITHSTTSQLSVSSCHSYSLNAFTYTGSGIYTQTLTNVQGCDSLLTLNLTITHSTSSQSSVTACNSYSLNNITYTNSGVYTQTLVNAQGCDSLITLYLQINHSSSRQVSVTACNNYSLNAATYTISGIYTQTLTNAAGCDSLLTLYLTLNHSSAKQLSVTTCGNSYTLNNTVYTSSGIYTQTLSNAAGCDSLLTLQLDIQNVTTSISQNGDELKAGNVAGASYQWLDCDADTLLPGLTSHNFFPQRDGNYAVIISLAPCTYTSGCFAYLSTGVLEEASSTALSIYPNPAKEEVHIISDRTLSVVLYTDLGQKIDAVELNNSNQYRYKFPELSQGVYLLHCIGKNTHFFRKLVVVK